MSQLGNCSDNTLAESILIP